MNISHFFKSFLFLSILSITLCVVSSPSIAGKNSNVAEGSDEEITSKLKKTSLSKARKTQPTSHPTHLVRVLNGSPVVCYTQQLEVQGKKFNLKRSTTTANINYVWKASQNDGYKTHLLAQGFCRGADTTWSAPFTVTNNFLDALEISCKKMVWVSQSSNAVSNNDCFIRKPQTDYSGGHAEPQFISDLEAAFTQNSDAVIEKFLPPADNQQDIYICGLELFGPYDMCDRDPFQGNRNNKYDCVGQLKEFRKKHQRGNQSISKAIRDKLKDKFKGEREDAFVLIYHAKSPYDKIDTYKAEDEDDYYSLAFEFKRNKFVPSNPKGFFTTSTLSQHKSLSTEKDVIYGYVHHIADKKTNYTPGIGFSFP